MENTIYENELIKVEIEKFEIPWLKIFTQEPIKEFSQCSTELQLEILRVLNIIETYMLEYFKPDKINIASFGNYVPHVHFHIQARFKQDSYFPEPTWGKKQRDMTLDLKDFDTFYSLVKQKLKILN
jgi:diadenosine tetraphosphate (Ap4A) HIT family hydrolase